MSGASITGLLKVELPDRTLLLCDGAFFEHDSETYRASDAVFGKVTGIRMSAEGVGREIPALQVTFKPRDTSTAITSVSSAAIQQSLVKRWVAEYDRDTGLIVDTPELRFIGYLDRPQISFSAGQMIISITAVPYLETMFFTNTGNGQSPDFHKSLYPGELGHDNATGLGVDVAHGTTTL